MGDFQSEIFLHPNDFFLDNFRGGDYEMLLALLAEKNLVLRRNENALRSLSTQRSPEKAYG